MNYPKFDNDVSSFNIVGIDPGTTHLGVSIITVSFEELSIVCSDAFTVDASKNVVQSWNGYVHNERFARIEYICKQLMQVLKDTRPLIVCAESPFFGMRHPGAYQALTELLTQIRLTVYNYDNWRELQLVPPSNVKQAVGQKGNVDKHAMKTALLSMCNVLKFHSFEKMNGLDEHSIDALAVGYYAYCNVRQTAVN